MKAKLIRFLRSLGILARKDELRTERSEDDDVPPVLDPHGDGTIREGDPMYAILKYAMETGQLVVGRITPDNEIIIDQIGLEDDD